MVYLSAECRQGANSDPNPDTNADEHAAAPDSAAEDPPTRTGDCRMASCEPGSCPIIGVDAGGLLRRHYMHMRGNTVHYSFTVC